MILKTMLVTFHTIFNNINKVENGVFLFLSTLGFTKICISYITILEFRINKIYSNITNNKQLNEH